MLGKLIKHEWRATYKVGGLMAVLTLVVTFLGWLCFQSPMWRQMSSESYRYSFNPFDFISVVVLMMYVFMLVGITYGTLIYLGVHFYKTMYTDQGYLTHTLPVGKHQLLASKLLVSGLWVLLVSILVFLSGIMVFGSLIGAVMPEEVTWASFWKEFSDLMGEVSTMLGEEMDLYLGSYLAVVIFSAIVSPFLTVTILFGSITVGQLFTKVRVLMAILCYLGVLMVNSLVTSAVQSFVTFNATKVGTLLDASMYSGLIVQLIIAVLLYIASYQIVTKKLNME